MNILTIFQKFLEALLTLVKTSVEPKLKGEIMYIVKDDNPDVGYSISYTAFDAEGNALDASATKSSVVSDNESVVSVLDGQIHFGAPGLANINVTVSDLNDVLLGSFGAQFTVTTGDPASISGGSITFDGLTEAPAPEPVPAPEA